MKIYFSAFVAITISMAVTSCKPETKGELGEPFDKVEGLSGTWKITSFAQVDLNNPIQEERDLSEFFIVDGQEATTISFTKDGRAFNVVPGPGRNYFGTEGTWGFDNDDAPSSLFLMNDEDTTRFELGSMVRSFDNSLVLQLKRTCDDGAGNLTDLVIYKFEFARQ